MIKSVGIIKQSPNNMKTKYTALDIILGITLVILGATARLLPHPANFVPLGAIAIFSGLFLPRKLALWLPLVALFVSDLFIGFYMWEVMGTVYASFLLTTFVATKIQPKFASVTGVTLVSSLFFFLTTNAAVWAFGTMYTRDVTGLIQSYTMALPFFRNSLLGDLFFTGILVGSYQLITLAVKNFQLRFQVQK